MQIAAVHDHGGVNPPSENQRPIKSILRPGFTAINNAFWESKILDGLLGSEIRLLLWLMKFTNGYLRSFCIIGEARLLAHTKLSRSALYDAKSSLEAKGHIIVQRTHSACAYQLSEDLQVLARAGDEPAKPRKKQIPLSSHSAPNVRQSGRHGSTVADTCKEDKESSDQQQAAAQPELPTNRVDDEPLVNSSIRIDERCRLVSQLKELGVHERVALRLVQAQESSVIARAIAHLPQVTTQNPVGYLVAEISRGGYREPDKTKPIRMVHEEIHTLRQAERDREAQERARSSEKVSLAVDQFSQLPATTQHLLLQQVHQLAEVENFTKIPGWSESHPAFRGLLAELVAQLPGQVLIE